MIEPDKIVIRDKDTTLTIIPATNETEILTSTMFNIQQTGLPSNADLDNFGDQILEMVNKSRKRAKDEKAHRIIDATENVVVSIKTAIQERNYDERIQEISKKIKAQSKNPVVVGNVFGNNFSDIGPLILNIGRFIVKDSDFRNLVISLIDVVYNMYSRVKIDKHGIKEAIQHDIANTPDARESKTRSVFQTVGEELRNNAEITDEERDELLDRSLLVLNNLKQNRDYKELVLQVMKIYDNAFYMVKKPELREKYNEGASIIDDVKVLIERTSRRSLEKWKTYLGRIVQIKDDECYRQLRHDLEDLLVDPENRYTNREDYKNISGKIKISINELNTRYNGAVNDFFEESREIIVAIANDPIVNRIGDDLNKLIQEVFVDEKGKPSLEAMKCSFSRIRDAFFPLIKDKLSTFDLPIIEMESPKFFFRISEVRLHLTELIPENLRIESDINVDFNLGKLERQGHFNVHINMDHISTKLKKVRFLIKKKTGMKYKDYGLITINLRDAGLRFSFHVKLKKDEVDYLECTRVTARLKGLRVKVIEARHDILDNLATKLFLQTFIPRIEDMIGRKLQEAINDEVCERVNLGLKNIRNQSRKKRIEGKINKLEIQEDLAVGDVRKERKLEQKKTKHETKKSKMEEKNLKFEIKKTEHEKKLELKKKPEHQDAVKLQKLRIKEENLKTEEKLQESFTKDKKHEAKDKKKVVEIEDKLQTKEVKKGRVVY